MKLWWASRMGALMSLSIVFSASAITNEWTKPSSGDWEEPFWSLGTLPSTSQEAVALINPGWKALAIGTNTTARHASSLTVNNLVIDAPIDSANQLLLNWAGVEVPLVVRSNLIVGTNGSIASHDSALNAANVLLEGAAAFSDYSRTTLERITMRRKGTLTINDVNLVSSNLLFLASGTITQAAGIAVFSRIDTDGGYGQYSFLYPMPSYHLLNGVLISEVASVGDYDLVDILNCTFFQSGGVHTNGVMTLWGGQRHFQQISRVGHYVLSGGMVVSRETRVLGGTIEQSGGTNRVSQLSIGWGGYYTMTGGQLVTSNTSVGTVDCLRNAFSQLGGSHSVQDRLVLAPMVSYSLWAGTLTAPTIEIHPDAALDVLGGTVSNPGTLILRRGRIRVPGGAPQEFGNLQVIGEPPYYGCYGGTPELPASLYVGSSNAPTVLRFADSRHIPWTGTLHIRNWSTNRSGNGPDRIFMGADSQALTPEQLRQVVFIRPSGLPSDYTAALTASGELVPFTVHDYDYVVTNGSLTITAYRGSDGNITIPGSIDNLPVTSIGNQAFSFETSLTSITLPNTITNIGADAFRYCTALTNVTFSEGLTSLGDFAFFGCSALTSINLPDSLVSVGSRVFEQCGALTRAEIGRGLAMFGGSHFFAYCENLSGVYFRGDAPEVISDFYSSSPTIYYLPGTVGWGPTYAGRPTVPWYLSKPVILNFGPSFGVRSNRFSFMISWATNATVRIEAATTNLYAPTWTELSSNTLTNGASYFSDPQWMSHSRRFYRVRSP